MCGIAGMMTRDGRAPGMDKAAAFLDALAHRGPDGRGVHRAEDVVLAHTRLSIIDLDTGDQPLYDAEGAALIGNGEIYNYVELRRELADTPFRTQSDMEPALALYRRDGLDFALGLRGMYGLAIHDPAAGVLVLARDPFGIKPLYYCEGSAGFAFASEPQALIAAGLAETGLRALSRAELLQLQFTTGADTIYPGIRRVLPGETLLVRGGQVVERRRRAALPRGGVRPMGLEEALAGLDRVLEDSVLVHQRADVDYAMFLSGGIDSTALLALMSRLNDSPVVAYTAGFDSTSVADERAQARKVAEALGARHVEIGFGESDFWALLPEIAAAIDDPAADYAVLPTYKLAQAAARDVKVILCGEGGDELFGGYGRYRSVMRPLLLGGRVMRARGSFDGLGVLRSDVGGWRDGIAAAEAREADGRRSRLAVAQAVDCADWLPNDLLTKLDRCLMAHGLEGRTPFLDPAVADFAYRLPDRLKIRKGHGKYLLRKWLHDCVPVAEPFGRKRGFTVPVGDWIAAKGARLGPLVAAQPGIAEICSPKAVETLFRTKGKREGFAAWTLLFYALWHRRHILGLPPGGDVFDCLSSH